MVICYAVFVGRGLHAATVRALDNPGLGRPITRLFAALRNTTYTKTEGRLHQRAAVRDAPGEMRNIKPRYLSHLLQGAESFLRR